MQKRLLSIVITYFPEKDLLEKNVSSFINEVEKILIWENTPESDKLKYRFIEHEKVEYCGDGINSISHGLNYGWHYAKNGGYDYLLTMDQDSIFEDFYFYLQQTVYNPESPQGLWGPNAYNMSHSSYKETHKMFTSGMLLDVNLINMLGGWNERLAIDCVDDYICLKAERLNIERYIFGECKLTHRLGIPKTINFHGHIINLRNDNPSRLYSIYKSHVMICRLYPEAKAYRKEAFTFWSKTCINVLLFEKNRVKKGIAILSGIFAGLFCKVT